MQHSSNTTKFVSPTEKKRLTKTQNVIGGEYTVTENYWTVSICRDKYAGNTQHAFLVIEGIKNGEHVLKLGDLVINDDKPATVTAISGKAIIRYRDLTLEKVKQRVDGFVHQTFQITQEEGQALLAAIEADAGRDDIVYNNLGNSKLYSGIFAGQATENCLTWAEGKLKGIGLKINTKWIDVLVAFPAWHLPEDGLVEGDNRTSGKCLVM